MEDVVEHLVDLVLFPGIDLLDVAGPAEAFTMANHLIPEGRPRYRLRYVAERAGPTATVSGLPVVADTVLTEIGGRLDTLIVPGAIRVEHGELIPELDLTLVDWLRVNHDRARRVAAVCAGSHLLAEAGILDGHRVTTHWATADQLARAYPAVEVDADLIFIRSGRVWTSAGITASLDLAIALIADDHGDDLAREVARRLVMYVNRPGGQSQFSVALSTTTETRTDVSELRRWIHDHLADDLSNTALADRLRVTPRHLSRVFLAETGSTPGRYVESARIERARWLLERTEKTLPTVAREAGFGSVETLHRVFRGALGVTPASYRARFSSPVSETA